MGPAPVALRCPASEHMSLRMLQAQPQLGRGAHAAGRDPLARRPHPASSQGSRGAAVAKPLPTSHVSADPPQLSTWLGQASLGQRGASRFAAASTLAAAAAAGCRRRRRGGRFNGGHARRGDATVRPAQGSDDGVGAALDKGSADHAEAAQEIDHILPGEELADAEQQRLEASGREDNVGRASCPGHEGRSQGIGEAFLLAVLRGYRELVSPLLPPSCRYYPSCSRYGIEAVLRYGAPQGLVLFLWRLLRCSPLVPFDRARDRLTWAYDRFCIVDKPEEWHARLFGGSGQGGGAGDAEQMDSDGNGKEGSTRK